MAQTLASKPQQSTGSDSSSKKKGLSRTMKIVRGILGFLALMVILEIAIRLSGIPEDEMPRVPTILLRTVTLVADGAFLLSLGSTLLVSFTGLAIATLIAVPLGIAFGSWRWVFESSTMLVELMRPVPAVVLLPPLILLMGTGLRMQLFLVSYAALWVVLNNVVYAVRDVDPLMKDAARTYGLSSLKTLATVTLPSAGPFIFAGVRIAATAALITTVSIEMIAGGTDGVGRWLLDSQYAVTRKADVFAGAFLLGVVGIGIHALFNFGDKVLFSWSIGNRKQTP